VDVDAEHGGGILQRSALGEAAKQSTVRGYQNALRMFCSYVSDPDYGWDRVCEQRFGTHPAQVFFEWNTATHVQDNEQSPAKRAFTKHELQDFFDHADDRVAVIAASARKGWLPAYRDATMFKVAYSYGLRFNELRHLQTVDFSRNAHAGEFGRYGVVQVRYGKAKKGSPPKRRGVLTVFTWTPEVITDWLAHGQACMGAGLDPPANEARWSPRTPCCADSVATVAILSCQTDWICTRYAAPTPPTS
jgi:integrase/recombinase XerD